jgi:hypothetical protein
MMRGWLTFAVASACLVLSACATARFESAAQPGAVVPLISGSQVYVYSFLDIRNADLGAPMVAAVHQQLVARLAEHGVEALVLTYGAATGKPVDLGTGTVRVPVERVVQGNSEVEAGFGADYRLIILPARMTLTGAGQNYRIDWTLVEVATGRAVWSTILRGGRTVWWNTSEDAEGRAAMFVNGAMAEMASAGMFAAAPAASE